MGVVLSTERYGGQWSTTFAFSGNLGWSETRRVVLLYPTAGGTTITLASASKKEIPFGWFVWVVINANPGISFTLTDGNWSKVLEGNTAAIIAKVDDGGTPRYVADKRVVLT